MIRVIGAIQPMKPDIPGLFISVKVKTFFFIFDAIRWLHAAILAEDVFKINRYACRASGFTPRREASNAARDEWAATSGSPEMIYNSAHPTICSEKGFPKSWREVMCQSCGLPQLTHEKKMPRRNFLFGAAMAASLTAASQTHAKMRKARKAEKGSETSPPKPENVLTPDAALARLIEGNNRYRKGLSRRHDFIAEREALVGGQNPYAGILSCADSRIAPEYAFDSSRGDLFVCRVAGNFVSAENIASFEFAVEVLKTPLLLVLGHDSCGAVKSAISSIADKTTLPGHLPYLVNALTPAVKAVVGKPGDELENATKENVRLGVEALKTSTPLLSAAVNDGRLKIIGGIYRLSNGQVDIFV